MSEEITEQPKPKNKGGRPRKVTTKLKKEEVVREVKTKDAKAGRYNEWPTKKAIEILIHEKDGEGAECIFQLGDSPMLRIRRDFRVIVPYDIKSILDDSIVDFPMCDMNGPKPVYYTQKKTRFPYSFFGEKTWEEYMDFLAAERNKK